ncbi:hypothetical protein HY025_05410 [Candidatus Daviesbacteria bacterium]|nr:hypothetical protein [Candidatus Daviesbacteria bacterium]
MTATTHALVGGAIAATIPDPVLGVSLALTSHIVLDMVPHWDFGWGWRKKTKLKFFLEAAFDLCLGFILSYLIFGQRVNFGYFVTCVLASEALDIIEAPYWFLNWRFPPFSWIYKFMSSIQGKAKLPWGIVTQVVAVFLLVIILKRI